MLAVAVEVGLFCTLRAKRCRRVPSLSLSVVAALPAILASMVAPAPLTAWWQTAGVVVSGDPLVVPAGQAAPGMWVEAQATRTWWVEAAVALEDQGRMHTLMA